MRGEHGLCVYVCICVPVCSDGHRLQTQRSGCKSSSVDTDKAGTLCRFICMAARSAALGSIVEIVSRKCANDTACEIIFERIWSGRGKRGIQFMNLDEWPFVFERRRAAIGDDGFAAQWWIFCWDAVCGVWKLYSARCACKKYALDLILILFRLYIRWTLFKYSSYSI